MRKKKLVSIILAGGKGSRIKYKTPKVLLKIKKITLLQASINLAKNFSDEIDIVINPSLKFLKDSYKKLNFFIQKKSLGTGHAVKEFFKHKKSYKKDLFIILYADTPFILKSDIKKMIKITKYYDLVILAFKTNSNKGCGLIKKNKNSVSEIIEYKNSNKEEKKIKICNSGVMVFNYRVKTFIDLIKKNYISQEFYLTDLVKICKDKGLKIGVIISKNEIRSRGINDIKTYKKNKRYFEKKVS
tara:strand:+ start:10 stop:738 length:729 start_codon:yes stop_codon:yes gene_type:complete